MSASRPRIATLASLATLAAAAVAPGCLDRPLEPLEPRTTVSVSETLTQTKVNKIDILLGIDNSKSMADKQTILAATVPDLVKALVNPPCLGKDGSTVATPEGPQSECPSGSRRPFDPVLDIHIGVLSTSIGSPT